MKASSFDKEENERKKTISGSAALISIHLSENSTVSLAVLQECNAEFAGVLFPKFAAQSKRQIFGQKQHLSVYIPKKDTITIDIRH